MKLKVFDKKNTEKSSKELPDIFKEEVRPDIIKRAVQAIQAGARQRYGANPLAGEKCSAKLSRRRKDYKGSYGHGISRVPRKILSRRGTRFSWVGAFAPGTVGGRRAHPPKATKILSKKINTKERRKAIRSAVAATISKELVKNRGHIIPEAYPFIITNEFENINKTKQVLDSLKTLGFSEELERASEKSIRSGRSRLRGRKYRKRKGPLFVVSKECLLLKSAANIPGVDVVIVNSLNAELLAPGSNPGRLTLFTESAIEKLGKENLFYCNTKTNSSKKEEITKRKTKDK